MPLGDIARSNVVRALKAFGGLRGDVPASLEETIMPVVVLSNEFPIAEPWSWGTTKAADPVLFSHVGFYNKDRRPDDPLGQVPSVVRIDHVRIVTSIAGDVSFGIVDAAVAGLGNPTSAAAANAAFQNTVVGTPLKITGVGKIEGLIAGLLGDQTYPSSSALIEADLPPIWLGPGYAWLVSPKVANVGITVWGRGVYYHAP